jgi:hypothetical protein
MTHYITLKNEAGKTVTVKVEGPSPWILTEYQTKKIQRKLGHLAPITGKIIILEFNQDWNNDRYVIYNKAV